MARNENVEEYGAHANNIFLKNLAGILFSLINSDRPPILVSIHSVLHWHVLDDFHSNTDMAMPLVAVQY